MQNAPSVEDCRDWEDHLWGAVLNDRPSKGTSSSHAILFVCMGNICRSPAGEGVLASVLQNRGLAERILVDSAGTISYHAGNPPDARMREAASRRGYHLQGRARQVTRTDLETFDLVIAMDRDNLADLQSLHPQPKSEIRLLSSFLHESDWPADVPDPYYGGAQGFEVVLDMIEAACPAIVEHLLGNPSREGPQE